MAAGFWYLEDGRCFSRKFSWMSLMIQLIVDELHRIPEAKDFAVYMNQFVMEGGDEYNGHGGFIKKDTGESIMMEFDLRSFTRENCNYFWKAAQKALDNLHRNDHSLKDFIPLFSILTDMKKQINRNEDPMLLNHCTQIEPHDGSKLGPGWNPTE